MKKQVFDTKLRAEIKCRDYANNVDITYHVEVPFDLGTYKSPGAEYTRNWCKQILAAYLTAHHSAYKLLLKADKGKTIQIYSINQ